MILIMGRKVKSKSFSNGSRKVSKRKPKGDPRVRTRKRNIGKEIVSDLTELCETLESGVPIESKFTVRDVELELKPKEYDADDIRNIRHSLRVSQAVFAQILAASVECVESWEQGKRKPPPMACRLLDLISRHKDHWISVLNDARKGTVTA
jgi:putative transcriptional regulator